MQFPRGFAVHGSEFRTLWVQEFGIQGPCKALDSGRRDVELGAGEWSVLLEFRCRFGVRVQGIMGLSPQRSVLWGVSQHEGLGGGGGGDKQRRNYPNKGSSESPFDFGMRYSCKG